MTFHNIPCSVVRYWILLSFLPHLIAARDSNKRFRDDFISTSSLLLLSSHKHATTAFSLNLTPSTGLLLQSASVMVTYTALVSYFDRPRGKLFVDPSFLETKQSTVDGGGLGLFATKYMPEGTILGTYPGVLRPAHKYRQKYDKFPGCSSYVWRFTDNLQFVDPTDANGNLNICCQGGTDDFPFSYIIHRAIGWKIPTMLARINEPPIGAGGCNVRSEENLDTREVVFSLSQSVSAGQELFMDYGLTYDRSAYGKSAVQDYGSE